MSRLLGIILAVGLTGCATDTYVVADSPPAVRAEVVATRPGFLWVHGHWAREGHRWDWKPGYYAPERPGQVYVEGRWQRNGNQYVWVSGTWRGHGGVVIRDQAPAPSQVGEINP